MASKNISFFLLSLFCLKGVIRGETVRITSASDFSEFVNSVNSGTTDYSGTTVYLNSDLSLSGESPEPIGNDSYQFRGVFDRQGYIISDFNMDASLEYVGLFGYSKGLTIRNVVLDSSCSVTSSFSGGKDAYVGGIIGRCETKSGLCDIDSNINMASVTFNGVLSTEYERYSYLGGIAGGICSSYYYILYVQNCANYGSITYSGTSKYSAMGGIVGWSKYNSDGDYIMGTLNYGAITYNGAASDGLYLGGIVGLSNSAYVKVCVSAGKISTQGTIPDANSIGGVVGKINGQYTRISSVYYTNDIGVSNIYGDGSENPYNKDVSDLLVYPVNATLISELSTIASNSRLDEWLLNINNASISFGINSANRFVLKSQIILLVKPANGERTFSGWYKDAELVSLLDSVQVDSDTTLFGAFCGSSYDVSLNVNGGANASYYSSINPFVITCNGYYGSLPTPTRDGYAFDGWFTGKEGGEKIESGDEITRTYKHALYAHWSGINYTVTFNATGGSVSETSKNVTFGSLYGELPVPKRSGYTFFAWFTEDSSMIFGNTTVSISSNHVLYARWNSGGKKESSETSSTILSEAGSSKESDKPDHVGALYPFIRLISLLI